MKRARRLAIAVMLPVVMMIVAGPLAAQQSPQEKEVWSLEDTYWQCVQANDLERYAKLWSEDFLGWPYTNPEPAGKDEITGWITAHTSKGEVLKSFEVEPLKAHVTGKYATVTYRIHFIWADKSGAEKPGIFRIIHTWLREGRSWQIISGMSAPTDASGH
jgi:ketosteroid isomerase-like protein